MSNYGNKQKHESKNLALRALLHRFKSAAIDLVDRVSPQTVLEVGCGEGYMLETFAEARPSLDLMGIDISEPAIDDARERLGDRAKLEVRDARELSTSGEKYDLVVMLEVLEHIPNPSQMLPVLEGLAAKHLLLSVPWEPFFRGLNFMRGKHVSAWGNDPEHVNHWGRSGFLDFVGGRFEVIETPLVFPWTMVLASVR